METGKYFMDNQVKKSPRKTVHQSKLSPNPLISLSLRPPAAPALGKTAYIIVLSVLQSYLCDWVIKGIHRTHLDFANTMSLFPSSDAELWASNTQFRRILLSVFDTLRMRFSVMVKSSFVLWIH